MREALGSARDGSLELEEGATLATLREALSREFPAFASLRSSTRLARNGALAPLDTRLGDGDEIALLPPVGGG